MPFGTKKAKKAAVPAVSAPEPAKTAKKAAKPRKKRVPFDPKAKIAGKATAAQLKARIKFLEDQVRWHQAGARGDHGGGKAARSKN
jgi:hypothetical protein